LGTNFVGKSFVISLIVIFFSIGTSNVIITLLSLDVAHTFFPSSFAAGATQAAGAAAVGAVAQVVTANTIFEVVFAVLMGFIAVRFNFRPLMLAGVGLILVSTIGSYFSPSLLSLVIFSSLEGGGTIMVGATGMSMVGHYIPFEKKAKMISYLIAVAMVVSLIGAPVVNAISSFGGWRLSYLLFAAPIAATGLLLSYFFLPRQNIIDKTSSYKQEVFKGFKSVLLNKSAVLCLLAGMLGGPAVMGTFAIAFYRQHLGMSLGFASMVMIIGILMYILASLVVGRFVNRVGARKLGIICAFANGIFMLIFFFMPTWYFALPLDMTHVWFGAAFFTSFQCLALDQVPKYRPTMMSMRSLSLSLNAMLGAVLGGTMLIVFGVYSAIGVSFGVLSIVASLAFIGTKDTTKACSTTEANRV
jgi:predicted MFS family arabinose efflux permease